MRCMSSTRARAALLPRLSKARAPLIHAIEVLDEHGQLRSLNIPAERPLTVYIDKRELVTLMTLGEQPELLVLGYLRNQGLVDGPDAIESITVDWEVGAAAVKTRAGLPGLAERTTRRTVTTGCGQGTVFGDQLQAIEARPLPPPAAARFSQRALYAMLAEVRSVDSIYKQAGSVHGCALFAGDAMLCHVEDVGRHNAIDTIAGWLWMQQLERAQLDAPVAFYTTGRLTSEMVMKAALMGVPIVVSRNGVTQMGQALAARLGLCLIGRAKGRHFLVYSGFDRFIPEPETT
ncbi:MAG: sulfurtransferase FdhD [Methylibium sp.]|nr:sulfurtransferase FdhD [Methylibium sp.]